MNTVEYSRIHSTIESSSSLNVTFFKKRANGLILQFKSSLNSLKGCPRELYVNFCLKFCESYSYFAISQILIIYLHTEFGFSDIQAGATYGLWGATITMWGLFTAWINDRLGVRKSLMLGFVISATATFILATTESKKVLYAVLFGLLPLGNSMGIPMLTVGIRRYTNAENRGFAFGLYYAVMNIAAFVSGPVVDMFNIELHGAKIMGRKFSGNRMVILTATVSSIISLFTTYLSLREIRVSQSQSRSPPQNSRFSATALTSSSLPVEIVTPTLEGDDEPLTDLSSSTINTSDSRTNVIGVNTQIDAEHIHHSESPLHMQIASIHHHSAASVKKSGCINAITDNTNSNRSDYKKIETLDTLPIVSCEEKDFALKDSEEYAHPDAALSLSRDDSDLELSSSTHSILHKPNSGLEKSPTRLSAGALLNGAEKLNPGTAAGANTDGSAAPPSEADGVEVYVPSTE